MLETILVPTDGSLTAQRAVDRAIERARSDGAELHALNVVETGSTVERALGGAWDRGEIAEELSDQAREELEVAMQPAREVGLDVQEVVLEHDDIVEGILSYAEKHDIDLVVMSTHGRAGVERMLLGSVAEGVLRKAHRPVLVVPPEHEP